MQILYYFVLYFFISVYSSRIEIQKWVCIAKFITFWTKQPNCNTILHKYDVIYRICIEQLFYLEVDFKKYCLITLYSTDSFVKFITFTAVFSMFCHRKILWLPNPSVYEIAAVDKRFNCFSNDQNRVLKVTVIWFCNLMWSEIMRPF